jgi:hypothetical protein
MNETKFSLGNYTIKGKAFKVVVDDAANSTLNGNKILTASDQGGFALINAPSIDPVLSNQERNPTWVVGDYSNSSFTCLVAPYAGPTGGSQFTLSKGTYTFALSLNAVINIDCISTYIADIVAPGAHFMSATSNGINNIGGISDERDFVFIHQITAPTQTLFFRINCNKLVGANPSSYTSCNLRIAKF